MPCLGLWEQAGALEAKPGIRVLVAEGKAPSRSGKAAGKWPRTHLGEAPA